MACRRFTFNERNLGLAVPVTLARKSYFQKLKE